MEPLSSNDFERKAEGSVCMATCTTLLRAFHRKPNADTEADGGGAVALGSARAGGASCTGASSAEDSDDSEDKDSKSTSAPDACVASPGREGKTGKLGRTGRASGKQSSDSGPNSGSEAEERKCHREVRERLR